MKEASAFQFPFQSGVHFHFQQDMASFKIATLQKDLDNAVPMVELEKANKQFTELTEKYRDILEKSNTLVVKQETTTGFEVSNISYMLWMIDSQTSQCVQGSDSI